MRMYLLYAHTPTDAAKPCFRKSVRVSATIDKNTFSRNIRNANV